MDAFDYNFAHSIGVFASTSKTGEVLEARDYLIANTKAPVAEFNQGILKQPHYKLARTLDRVLAYYSRAKVPFRLHVPVEDDGVTAKLLARRFERGPDLPVMLLRERARAVEVPGLTVKQVASGSGLEHFQRIAFESFGYPVEIAPVALTDDLAGLSHVALFVGYFGEEPACCSMLLITSDVAGIYWVGTLAAHRSRGLGAAITAHAAHQGFARGCKIACLQASPLGAPVYHRIGFEHARSYLRFDHAAP
jgi:GNAT superfamily N-acetyltransferase